MSRAWEPTSGNIVAVGAPVRVGVVVTVAKCCSVAQIEADVGHRRPHLLVVGAELLGCRVDSAVVVAAVAKAKQVSDFVDDGGHPEAANEVDTSRQVPADHAGFHVDDVLAAALPDRAPAAQRAGASLVRAASRTAALKLDIGIAVAKHEGDVGDRRPHVERSDERVLFRIGEVRRRVIRVAKRGASTGGGRAPLVGGVRSLAPPRIVLNGAIGVNASEVRNLLFECRRDGRGCRGGLRFLHGH